MCLIKIFKMLLKLFLFLFLSINLCHCFIVPQIRIYQALKNKSCDKLSVNLFYDLSIKQMHTGVDVCLEKQKYDRALLFLDYLEDHESELVDKVRILKKKAYIYMNNLFQYSKAIQEFEKILKYTKNDYTILLLLIEARIKNQSFQRALEDTQHLLTKQFDKPQRLKLQFIRARLLLLLQQRQKALQAFEAIKKEDKVFFEKHQGSFYTALLLEEEKRFLEAIKELESIQWPFKQEKSEHWKSRNKNAPKRRRL